MNKENESFFGMTLKVKNFGVNNAVELNSIPAIKSCFAQLDAQIVALIKADTGGRADLTGVTINKSNTRATLETYGKQVSNALSAYAVVSENVELLKRADTLSSSWYKFSEEELITQGTIIFGLAKPLMSELALYGAKEIDVLNLEKALTLFASAVSSPSLAIDQRKVDNKQVVKIIGEMRDHFNSKLDILMRSFEVGQPELYERYKLARAVDINGSITQPTAVVEVAPKAVAQVFTAPYKADTLFTLRNTGAEVVFFSLSAKNTEAGTTEVALFPGETRSRLAKNLAPSGTFLMVRNEGETIAPIKIWVE